MLQMKETKGEDLRHTIAKSFYFTRGCSPLLSSLVEQKGPGGEIRRAEDWRRRTEEQRKRRLLRDRDCLARD
jgi:hypothetical protein